MSAWTLPRRGGSGQVQQVPALTDIFALILESFQALAVNSSWMFVLAGELHKRTFFTIDEFVEDADIGIESCPAASQNIGS